VTATRAPIRIANCSGFYGDRFSAAREMVEGGPIDVLSGDWLAELTMLILARSQGKDPAAGYATTFVRQLEQVMGSCLDRGIKVVANAGGLNPKGCAEAVEKTAATLGLSPTVAYVTGDDLLPRLDSLRASGHELAHLDTGEALGQRAVITANAYLGCWGIVEALRQGADIVITGRTTDASMAMGPAAWWFDWAESDWDELAGACVAGHIIECGCQCTGGNYAFFREVPGLEHPGFPIAEISQDGSSVITKHEGTGGLVSAGTVTAQLLYEIGGPRYLNPDVVARFDTIVLDEAGPDRVRVSGVRGEPAPSQIKVGLNFEGGARNSISFRLTGLDIPEKAALIERTLRASLSRELEAGAEMTTELVRGDHPDPLSNEWSVAELTVTVKAADAGLIGRSFAAAGIEMALASYPGFFTAGPPTAARPYGVFWPSLLPADLVEQQVTVRGNTTTVRPSTAPAGEPGPIVPATAAILPDEPVRMVPLGTIIGARSGDKGGHANLGLWARSAAGYAWLSAYLTAERMRELFPEARAFGLERYELPNLYALNFIFRGLLGEGVAASTRLDPQAKGLGEYVRARHVPVPVRLLPG
jgi:hypothetical protein